MELGPVLDSIAETGIKNNPEKECDYIGEDGLLMCGVCHAPKRMYIDILGERRLVSTKCKCQEEEDRKKKEEAKRIENLKKVRELRVGSLMDEKFYECTFDKCIATKDNERQINTCRRYAEKFDTMYKNNQGLLLYGDVGTGKSHLAACIANEVMKNFHSVYATSFVKLLKVNAGRIGDEELIKKMENAKLVIFDDLGAERSTDFAIELVYNMIDSRYRQMKPMIITTNLTLEQMKSAEDTRYSRIYDRVFEVCYPVHFKGTSFRKKEAKIRYNEMKEILEGR